MNKRKEDLIYVGIDLHKESHTAVILDCWNTKLGEITFANTPAEFPKQIRKVNKFCPDIHQRESPKPHIQRLLRPQTGRR